MRNLLMIAFTLLSLNAGAASVQEHCKYLNDTDPAACQTSTYCNANKQIQGSCKSTSGQAYFESICATITYGEDACNVNQAFQCHFVKEIKITCSPK